ncbi:MAG: DNA methyltransferase, partial [Thermoguttaceae bacterium]
MDAVPTLEVLDRDAMSQVARDNWTASGLDGWDLPVEEWTSAASNRALQYATHGIFRYFGKFPPLVARRLICQFTRPGDLVLDPMIGSGTTAVEAGLLGRRCAALDVNPLSLLLTRVKCRRIAASRLRRRLAELLAAVSRRGVAEPACPALWPTGVKTSHWFLPQTSHWLHVMRECIAALPDPAERDFFLAVYAGIIRRVSRATTQQGRLFLDAATAEPDPRPRFAAAAKDAIEAVASLGRNASDVTVLQASAMDCDFTRWKAPLVICHPPYFNVYKYSGIFSLEMAWLGYEIQAIRRQEIREFFKVGKPEKVA